ncbi:DUF305 domain-containing protein [Aliihoeflea aestuarii]|jgi:uncharacterized protein (DUF305 family)|uniref:CopM family metallochaperone n=1 Tax=Aliihoeflea aestuarii TaxID=453840 RepID=UPI0020953011|nr:DUF305 domain-containing protein [Aliihoeflea aestuarii]MCO6392956.1 DUF305 domain-containing protein [Aliihoeflea aestuarii]
MNKLVPIALAAFVASVGFAVAQNATTGHEGHGGHSMTNTDAAAETPATAAYRAANDRMHEAMTEDFTGDADVDFMRGMIPHHQGAIDMARIVLEHGSDPQVRALAEEVIATQEAEIDMMEKWLAEHGR